MPRLAAISDDLASGLDDALAVAVRAGLDGLAIRHLDGVNVRELDDAALREAGAAIRDAGLAVVAVSSPVGRDVPVDADDRAARELLERMLRAAELLGTDLVRVFASWLPGRDPIPLWRPRPPAVPERVVERLADYARRAEERGLRLMLELEGASHVGTGAEAREVVRAVGSPALALCWDVCNGWWSGESPWEESWPAVRELPIADVQLKDVRAVTGDPGVAEVEQVVLGTGAIPYGRILGALDEEGYDGWLTVERVYHPRRPELEPELRRDVLADIAALRGLARGKGA